jgi:hypothetical protein
MEKLKTGPKPETGETRKNLVTVKFTDKEISEIDKIAKETDIPRTTLIRNMTLSGLEDAKILNKIGALKGAKKLIDFKDRFFNNHKYPTFEAQLS